MREKLRKLMYRRTYRDIVIMGIFLLILSLGSFTLAKYVVNEFHGYYLNAKHFYFTSNRLKRTTARYDVNNWSGVGAFEIPFELSSVKNDYIFTQYDIPYEVTATCPQQDATCTVDKPTGTIYYSQQGTHSDKVTVHVTPLHSFTENAQLTIYIEAKSTAPYVETLSAYFSYIVGKKGVTYKIEDEANRPYLLLNITNAVNFCVATEDFGIYHTNDEVPGSVYRTLSDVDKAKCISKSIQLDFSPNDVLLDTTSKILDISTYQSTTLNGISYINQLNFNIEPTSTMAIKFYKVSASRNYTYPDTNPTSIITVTVS